MENWIKQMRMRVPSTRDENKEDTNRRIPPQKTRSFKGENKKGQNWFRRQFSREMSRNYAGKEGDEFSTAVAASAFAISSIEETQIPKPKKTKEGPPPSLSEIKSAAEDGTIPISKPSSVSRKFSEGREKRASFSADMDEKVPERAIQLSGDKQLNRNTNTELKDEVPRKTIDSAPSIKKNPTFAERIASINPEDQVPKASSSHLPTEQFTFPQAEIKNQSSTKPRIGDSKADVWEKSQMEKIKERYEKLVTKINEWENAKKTKAKRKMARREGQLESKRARELQDYKSTVEMIDQIVVGARSQAEENRRKEEFKVKEKANKIRSTGKLPSTTCFCF